MLFGVWAMQSSLFFRIPGHVEMRWMLVKSRVVFLLFFRAVRGQLSLFLFHRLSSTLTQGTAPKKGRRSCICNVDWRWRFSLFFRVRDLHPHLHPSTDRTYLLPCG